jgi:hypothetical protein
VRPAEHLVLTDAELESGRRERPRAYATNGPPTRCGRDARGVRGLRSGMRVHVVGMQLTIPSGRVAG